jgi:hypothetical protein
MKTSKFEVRPDKRNPEIKHVWRTFEDDETGESGSSIIAQNINLSDAIAQHAAAKRQIIEAEETLDAARESEENWSRIVGELESERDEKRTASKEK